MARGRRGRVWRGATAMLGVMLAAGMPGAQAQQGGAAPQAGAAQGFAIPRQSVADALAAFSAATGLQASAPTALVTGRASPGVSGSMSREAALATLLGGTGLTGRIENGSVIVAQVPEVRPGRGAVELPQVDVTAASGPSPTGQIGVPVRVFAGGQVAASGRLGMLGTQDRMTTPFSTSAYTADYIQDRQARTIQEALASDPTLRSTANRYGFGSSYTLRGFQLGEADATFDGLVGIVPRGRFVPESLERIEVLRGPSALLSGAGIGTSIAGLLNLVPKRAGDVPLTRLTLGALSTGNFGAAVDVGRRFGEGNRWGVRLNAGLRDGDTPLDEQRERNGSVTTALDYRGERLRVTFDGGYLNRRVERYAQGVSLGVGAMLPAAPSGRTTFAPNWQQVDIETVYGATRAELDVGPNTTLGMAFGGSWGQEQSLQTVLSNLRSDGSVTATPGYFPYWTRTYTGEASVRHRFETGPLRHTVTLVGNRTLRDASFGSFFPVAGSAAVTQNIYSPFNVTRPNITGIDRYGRKTQQTELTSLALADTVSIFEDRLQITAGVRWQRIEQNNYSITTGGRTSRYDADAYSPAFGIVYRPLAEVSLFANYIEGLVQGPIAPTTARNAGTVFAPALARNYEAGVKVERGGLGGQVSLFQMTQQSGVTDPGTNIFGLIGQQRSRGVELQAFGEPYTGLRLIGGVTFIEPELTRTASGTTNGNRPPGAPRILASADVEADVPPVPGLAVYGRAIHTGATYLDAANQQRAPSWTRFDLGARYRFDVNGTPLTARASIENVADTNYWLVSTFGALNLGIPRTYLFSLSADL